MVLYDRIYGCAPAEGEVITFIFGGIMLLLSGQIAIPLLYIHGIFELEMMLLVLPHLINSRMGGGGFNPVNYIVPPGCWSHRTQ